MTDIFKGMSEYRAKCHGQSVVDFLHDIEDPTARERLLESLEWLKETDLP